MALTIWLVRHGETASNAEGIFQGHLDIDLNLRGEQQARAVGEWLRDVQFNAVYSSDLLRAARTAELIVAGRAAVTLDPDLREMNYGILQGVRYVDAAATLEPHGLGEAWISGDMQRRGTAMPSGESARQFRSRSSRFVKMLEQTHGACDDTVLVVAHGGKLSVLLTVLLGLPGQMRHSFRFANCAVSRITWHYDHAMLDFHNMVVWDDRWAISSPVTRGPLHPRGE